MAWQTIRGSMVVSRAQANRGFWRGAVAMAVSFCVLAVLAVVEAPSAHIPLSENIFAFAMLAVMMAGIARYQARKAYFDKDIHIEYEFDQGAFTMRQDHDYALRMPWEKIRAVRESATQLIFDCRPVTINVEKTGFSSSGLVALRQMLMQKLGARAKFAAR